MPRPATVAPLLAVLAVVLVTLGAYIAGYLLLCEKAVTLVATDDGTRREVTIRRYPYKWLATAFLPAVQMERVARRREIKITGPNEPYWQFIWD